MLIRKCPFVYIQAEKNDISQLTNPHAKTWNRGWGFSETNPGLYGPSAIHQDVYHIDYH